MAAPMDAVVGALAMNWAIFREYGRFVIVVVLIHNALALIGVYELTHCVDIPYRVAINEALELAKSFGGTDGHKYVNGVLDKAAADLRPAEVQARR